MLLYFLLAFVASIGLVFWFNLWRERRKSPPAPAAPVYPPKPAVFLYMVQAFKEVDNGQEGLQVDFYFQVVNFNYYTCYISVAFRDYADNRWLMHPDDGINEYVAPGFPRNRIGASRKFDRLRSDDYLEERLFIPFKEFHFSGVYDLVPRLEFATDFEAHPVVGFDLDPIQVKIPG